MKYAEKGTVHFTPHLQSLPSDIIQDEDRPPHVHWHKNDTE